VGATTTPLKERIHHHKGKANRSGSKYIPADYEWEMRLLEECTLEDKVARERYWYSTLHPLYNIQTPGQSKAEYDRKYRETEGYKEALKARQQSEEHKEYHREYNAAHMEEHNAYRRTEKYHEYAQKYRDDNREAIRATHREYMKNYRAAKKAAKAAEAKKD
jgi:hypothetical protein